MVNIREYVLMGFHICSKDIRLPVRIIFSKLFFLLLLLLFSHSVVSLCNPVDCSTPGSSVLHYIQEFAQTHIHWVGDAIQPSHPLLTPSPHALNLSQHQHLSQWVSSSHRVALRISSKLLELQHQSFQWIFRVDFL